MGYVFKLNWKAKTDRCFLKYIRQQKCMFTDKYSYKTVDINELFIPLSLNEKDDSVHTIML